MGREGPIAGWAPRAKLAPPAIPPDVVLDDALVARVRDLVITRPLTLITAAPGSGKTTLAAAVTASMSPITWVRLDEHDDDPATVLELVATASVDAVGDELLTVEPLLLRGITSATDARRAAAVLLDDLERAACGRAHPAVVVFDDLHVLAAPATMALLEFVVEHLPASVRLVTTSRREPGLPLARLRARGVVGEVDGTDLALGPEQAARLLNDHLGLDIDDGGVAALVASSSGWVTGIRLLGRSPETLDRYLDEELLDHEPPDVARFLTDLAVLDSITPLAAAALTGREDAGALLAGLARRHSLFVQVVDRDEPAYRLHDLLRSHLLRRLRTLDPLRTTLLHQAAATVARSTADKIEHLLAAEAWDDAADAIDDAVDLLAPSSKLQRAASWVRRLPDGHRERTRLRIVDGLAAASRGDVGRAVDRLDPLLPDLERGDDTAAALAVVRTLHVASYDHDRYVPKLLDIEQRPTFQGLPPSARAEHHVSSAYGALFAGAWDEVGRRVAAAVDVTVRAADVDAAEALALHLSPMLGAAPGVLDRVATYADWAAERLPARPLVGAGIVHQRAWVHLLRGAPSTAAAVLRSSPAVRALIERIPYLRTTADWVLTVAAMTEGDPRTAEDHLRSAIDVEDASELDDSLDDLRRVLLARLLRQRGDVDELRRLEQRVALVADGGPRLEHSANVRPSIEGQRRWAEGDLAGAERCLRGALDVELFERVRPLVTSARIDLALVLAARGDEREASAILADAVASFSAWGTPGLLVAAGPEVVPLLRRLPRGPTVDVALAVLGTDAMPAPVPVPGTGEVLTGREVQVLRLLDRGASNQVIAAELVISANTAKTHVRNVLSKLGARSRGEAVAAARRRHLL